MNLWLWKSYQTKTMMITVMMGDTTLTHTGVTMPRTKTTRTSNSLGAPPTAIENLTKLTKVGKRIGGVSGKATQVQAVPGSEGSCSKAMLFLYNRMCAMDGSGHFQHSLKVMMVIETNSHT